MQNQKQPLKLKIKNPDLSLSLSLSFSLFKLSLVSTFLCLHHVTTSLSFHCNQNVLSLSIFSSFLMSLFLYFEIWVYHLFKSLKSQRFIVFDLIYLVIYLSYHLSKLKHKLKNLKSKLKKIETLTHFYFVYLICILLTICLIHFIDNLFDLSCWLICSPNVPNWWLRSA